MKDILRPMLELFVALPGLLLAYCLYNSSSEIMSFTSSPYLLYKDTSQRFVSLQSRRCFLDRGSVGFSAVSGIAHDRPKRSAPGIRPSVQY